MIWGQWELCNWCTHRTSCAELENFRTDIIPIKMVFMHGDFQDSSGCTISKMAQKWLPIETKSRYFGVYRLVLCSASSNAIHSKMLWMSRPVPSCLSIQRNMAGSCNQKIFTLDYISSQFDLFNYRNHPKIMLWEKRALVKERVIWNTTL